MAAAKKGRLTIACENEGSSARLSERCIAALSWEQLAYAALREGVVISLRACGECSYDACKKVIEQNLDELRFFLGDELYQERVTVLREGDVYEGATGEEAISRRELFSFFSNLSVDTAFTMMPKVDKVRDNGLVYRAMLRDIVTQQAADSEPAARPKYAVKLPRFTKTCYNCGYCNTTCPTGALKFVQGENGFTVAVDVWRCTSCGLCKEKCRVKGISGIVPMRVSTLGTVGLAKLPDHLCSVCGKPFAYPTDGKDICKACQTKQRTEGMRKAREEKKRQKALEAEAAALAAAQAQETETDNEAEAAAQAQGMKGDETAEAAALVAAQEPGTVETEIQTLNAQTPAAGETEPAQKTEAAQAAAQMSPESQTPDGE